MCRDCHASCNAGQQQTSLSKHCSVARLTTTPTRTFDGKALTHYAGKVMYTSNITDHNCQASLSSFFLLLFDNCELWRLQAKLPHTMLANWCLWPIAHTINFYYVPTGQRILYNNSIAVRCSCDALCHSVPFCAVLCHSDPFCALKQARVLASHDRGQHTSCCWAVCVCATALSAIYAACSYEQCVSQLEVSVSHQSHSVCIFAPQANAHQVRACRWCGAQFCHTWRTKTGSATACMAVCYTERARRCCQLECNKMRYLDRAGCAVCGKAGWLHDAHMRLRCD